ncbi:MAG TPA: hypothetical protein VIT91_17665 [Chthoniobacterales bacterium]
MSSEELDINAIMEDRRQAVAKSIQPISGDEVKALGERLFPFLDHPWREPFFTFVKENVGSSFYHAETHDGIHVLYCRDREKGIWFVPGRGLGPLQKRALAILKEIVDVR